MRRSAPDLKAIFGQALELDSTADRARCLAEACGDDAVLRGEVESLLMAFGGAGDFLEAPAPAPTLTVETPRAIEGPGSQIGPYKLLEQIGEGGMGVVFMAEQARPVRRRVALKVIKPGMDTRQVVARFEAERQALAMMDHPNIARVLEAGTTDSGRPYFVMELVRGIPITDYCDRERLALKDRLDLFVLVCKAVQHAHQKGIIHRDIKPSNVLVTLHDGVPVPKVIDFGIAKATGGQLTEKTLFTAFAQMVGTPLYMSPEQAELSGLDVDTRSDIYSLGVLLYELLTGTTPFDPEALKKAAFDEMRRMIREEEPPTPSTRLSTLGETLSETSAKRSSDPRHLNRAVRGELDWIAMKALEKDRSRRYETANDFASDVVRYLADKPVEACPPSTWYRLRKSARRNRVALVTAGLVTVALVVGTAVSTWQAVTAARARKETVAINEFLVNDLLAQADPEHHPTAEPPTLREVLDRAAEKVGTKFRGRPRLEASLRATIGETYHGLGAWAESRTQAAAALAIFERELGPEAVETLNAARRLGHALDHENKYDEAEPLLRGSVDDLCRVLGEGHPDALEAMADLASLYQHQNKLSEAETLFVKALDGRRRVLGEEHEVTLTTMNNLAMLYRDQRQYLKAGPLRVKVLEVSRRVLGKGHRGTIAPLHNVATMYLGQGRLAQAKALLDEAFEVSLRVNGEEHPDTLSVMYSLGSVYLRQSDYPMAEPLLVRLLEIRRRVQGEEHRDTLAAMDLLAASYQNQGKLAQAEPLRVKELELSRRVHGEEEDRTLNAMNCLALLYANQGKPAQAEHLYVKAVETGRRVLGEEDPGTLVFMANLAGLYTDQGKFAQAESLYVKVLEAKRRVLGEEHPDLLPFLFNLGNVYEGQGEFDKAEPHYAQALGIHRKQIARGQPGLPADPLATILRYLGEAYERAGQFVKAEPLHRERLEAVREGHTGASSASVGYQATLALNLLKQRRFAEAEPLLRECLKFREQNEPNDWRTFNTKSMLGGSLLGQNGYDEAEPLLLAGYEGMEQREGAIPPDFRKVRLTAAIERLVQLYEATGRKDRAAEWRAKLPPAAVELPADVFARP